MAVHVIRPRSRGTKTFCGQKVDKNFTTDYCRPDELEERIAAGFFRCSTCRAAMDKEGAWELCTHCKKFPAAGKKGLCRICLWL